MNTTRSPEADDPRPPVTRELLRKRAREVLELQWHDAGFTMPNGATYPWQWLWDSCFHAIVWAELGDERALIELDRVFTYQTSRGFVPHMNYLPNPKAAVEVWGKVGASTITQPPMYGHAVAELAKRGFVPSDKVIDAAHRGLAFLLAHRRRSASGLIELCHPWESGCDDSARWDSALDEPWSKDRWRHHKIELLSTIDTDGEGAAIANDNFDVASVGFNALVAFNAAELGTYLDDSALLASANELGEAIAQRWRADKRTWVDDGQTTQASADVRTVDAHLALLIDSDPDRVVPAIRDLVDEAAFGAAYGPAGVHRDEPSRQPLEYWRGSTWPQLSYLLWIAVGRSDAAAAKKLALALQQGAALSGWAEYWDPDTGEGGGAVPQTWASVAVLVD